MPQEMTINSAVDHGQAQPRGEKVFQLFPEVFGVGFFVFHGHGPERKKSGSKAPTGVGVKLPHSTTRRCGVPADGD